VLGLGGRAALLVGSLMVTREVPGIAVGLDVIVPVVAAAAAIVLGLGRLGLQARRLQRPAGSDALVGAPAEALTPLGPDAPGQIRVRGEIWRAVSAQPLPAGQPVRVVHVSGLTAHVRSSDDPPPGGST
jgi:membrane-bound serine protease (ClpP class)